MVMESLYFSGTSGILLPYKNKSFYPENLQEKSRLAVYALLFNSLEVNSSFYKIPRGETVKRWADEVPDGFRFTFKLWKGITHAKGLIFDPNDVTHFLKVIAEAGEKKGCLLIQFPPSVTFNAAVHVNLLLETVVNDEHIKGWRVCVEFRHPSWHCEDTFSLLNSYGASLVLHDKNSNGMQLSYSETDFIYLRFHGPNGNYRGSYEDDFLQEYSSYIREWLAEGKEVFTYFNNTMGDAIQNLKLLSEYVNDTY